MSQLRPSVPQETRAWTGGPAPLQCALRQASIFPFFLFFEGEEFSF